MRVLVIHGPSLNLLGTREPQIYGNKTLDEINREIESAANQHSIELRCMQSNDEGNIIDAIHDARDSADFIIINPGAYSHYS
ncbi:MAG: type II 3-dehydroquinate dehydratase, partial [Candidatus Eremiobacteraeota bacterium]|nr:type II 3-dehydroquinate dehydratase [Candidatus Eremiobacteraeota bacterium]